MKRLMNTAAVAGLILGWSATVQAGVTVTVQEVAGDVVMTGDGSIDLSQANSFGNISHSGFFGENRVTVGAAGTAGLFSATVAVQPNPPFAENSPAAAADSGTGDLIGIDDSGVLLLFVPAGYGSGQPLSGTATYAGETLNSLGLEAGIYRWEWNTSTPGVTDFFEVVVIAPPIGACCVGDACLEATESSCTSAGGQYFGDGVACSAVTCPTGPVTGACCIDDVCLIAEQTECETAGGTFGGDGVDCGSVVCEAACPADITDANGNGPDGVVDVFDLLALLAAWGACF